jgi:CRISPR-associated protein Csy1
MNEVGLIAVNFLETQKSDYLERKVAQETRERKKKLDILLVKHGNDDEHEELVKEKSKYEEAVSKAKEKLSPEANKKYEISFWFNEAFKKSKPYITTHPAKFTNPKISDTTGLLFYGDDCRDGYVRTGNVRLAVKIDVSGNAATNTIIFELYSLLDRKTKDGNRLIDLFEQDNYDLIEFINSLGINYSSMKEKCLDVFYGKDSMQSTHELVRQVYFPVDANTDKYHLLSIVTPSMLMFEVKNRIEAFDRWIDGHHVRGFKKNNKYDEVGFDEIYDITEIGFSHKEFTKMGNVSYLNVRNKGTAYLLPGIPPVFQERHTRLPARNFFRNSLSTRRFQDSFQTLDRLMHSGVNNMHVREGIRNTLKYLIDSVLQQAFRIRLQGPGWSGKEHYQTLPLAQRIWLDDAYLEQREQNEDWLDEVAGDFAHWIIRTYEYLCKDSRTKLGDEEFRELVSLAEQAVAADKEFFK